MTPGLLILLVQIVTNNELDIGVRTSGAVFLKNEIRRHWDSPQHKENAKSYSPEEKKTVRDLLVPLLESVISSDGIPHAIVNSIDDCVRCVCHADYPEQWPEILSIIVEVSRMMKISSCGSVPCSNNS